MAPALRLNNEAVDPWSEVVAVSPERAMAWLERNPGNRPISQKTVRDYATDMKRGHWRLAQPIIFDWNGDLADGQHRLWAVIESGQTVRFVVQHGLDPIDRDKLDGGKKRSPGDMLWMRGEKNVAALAGGLKDLWNWERKSYASNKVSPTREELKETLDRHPRMRECASLSSNFAAFFSPSKGTLLLYLFSAISPGDCVDFFAELKTGAGLGDRDPVLVLRDKLLFTKQNRGVTVQDYVKIAWAIKAWNARRKGRKITKASLTFNPGEDFPVPV